MSAAKKKKGGRGCLIALIILLFLVAAAVGAAYGVFRHYMGKMNYEEIDPSDSIVIDTDASLDDEETESGTDSPQDLIDQYNQDLEEHINGNGGGTSGSGEDGSSDHTSNPSAVDVKGVEHILLIGVDRRTQNERGRSDSMILVSINHNTKKIVMTSIMRDTYVYIEGVGNNRINAAYSRGGAALLLDTIRKNWKVNVTQYAMVDFNAFTSMINVIGTIPMTLNDAEIAYMGGQLNNLQHEGNLYYLDGASALTFARIRYVGKWDFERTERQRRVLTEIFKKMKSMDLGQLNSMADAVLPYVTHNLSETKVLSLLLQSPQLLGYELVSNRVPYDGMYTSAVIERRSVLCLDWSRNIAEMNRIIYGQ